MNVYCLFSRKRKYVHCGKKKKGSYELFVAPYIDLDFCPQSTSKVEFVRAKIWQRGNKQKPPIILCWVVAVYYICYIYFPMDFFWVLQPFRSSKISSDTDTKVGISICCWFRSTLAQYSEGVKKFGLGCPPTSTEGSPIRWSFNKNGWVSHSKFVRLLQAF